MLRSFDMFDNIDELVFVTERRRGWGANIVATLRRFTNTTLKIMGEESVTWKC